MSTNIAVGSERISKTVGYSIVGVDLKEITPNLPQRVAVLAEANFANQGALSLTPVQITSLSQAATLYGYGSPIYNIVRILKPQPSVGLGGIPIIVYPQAESDSAVAAARDVTPSGTATAAAVHTLVINGREGIDGIRFDFNVALGDQVGELVPKIISSVNAVLGSTVVATDGTGKVTLTAKWKGKTSEGISVTVNTNGKANGMTYGVVSSATGINTPSVTAALNLFGSEWNTIVINSYADDAFAQLEAINGIPDKTSPTGKYTGVIMRPFIALYGDTSADTSTLTNVAARKTQVTNASCPAPNSAGLPMEAAANMAILLGRIAQDSPHLDVSGKSYSDMPIPLDGDIGIMKVYDERDAIVKKGGSTIDLIAGRYQVQDLVTTYNPAGETPPQFRYPRNLMLDFNVRYGYYLLELANVVDKVIANDADTVDVSETVKPKQWKQILSAYADSLAKRALISDPEFMKKSLAVQVNATNPDRLDTNFSYKRTGTVRISATVAEAGFNFGN